jgi:hypothetical protein
MKPKVKMHVCRMTRTRNPNMMRFAPYQHVVNDIGLRSYIFTDLFLPSQKTTILEFEPLSANNHRSEPIIRSSCRWRHSGAPTRILRKDQYSLHMISLNWIEMSRRLAGSRSYRNGMTCAKRMSLLSVAICSGCMNEKFISGK